LEQAVKGTGTINSRKIGQRSSLVRDERLKKMARLLSEYCVWAGEGDQVLIEGGTAAEPLIKEIYIYLLRVGAIPIPQVALPGMGELFFKYAKDIHYKETPPTVWALNESADAWITIMAPTNTRALAGVDPRKQQALSKRNEDFENMVMGKERWVLTLFPTEARAQEAEMSLDDYEEFVFGAMALGEDDPVRYWQEEAKERNLIIERLQGTRQIRVIAPGTDLTLSVKGREFINDDGRYNMPGGEVATSPVEDSANGEVFFGLPMAVAGREISGVRLRFEEGKVVESSAEKGEEYLNATLESDEGARYLGEIGIGTNYGIQRATKSGLFDEKIGGTVHLAVGYSLPEAGGKNHSSVHQDLICDLREGGEIYADGKLIHKDGRFVGFDPG
jgi:aminopeptidase